MSLRCHTISIGQSYGEATKVIHYRLVWPVKLASPSPISPQTPDMTRTELLNYQSVLTARLALATHIKRNQDS